MGCRQSTATSSITPSGSENEFARSHHSKKEEVSYGLTLPCKFLELYEIVLNDKKEPLILGLGSFSKVFKVVHTTSKDQFALKYVDMKHIANRGKAAVDRTQGEVRRGVSVLQNLHHPSIINLIDYFESPNTMCVVLELAGVELYDHVVEKGKLTEMETAEILRSIAEGVHFMHEKNLVHRDLKPENVVLSFSSGDKWKIIDFGFSRMIETKMTRMKSFVGTMNYVAPGELCLFRYI